MEIKKIKDWIKDKPEPQFRLVQMYRSDTFELVEVAIRLKDNEIFMLGYIDDMTILKFHYDMVHIDYKSKDLPNPEEIVTDQINNFHPGWASTSKFRSVSHSKYPKMSKDELMEEFNKIKKKLK